MNEQKGDRLVSWQTLRSRRNAVEDTREIRHTHLRGTIVLRTAVAPRGVLEVSLNGVNMRHPVQPRQQYRRSRHYIQVKQRERSASSPVRSRGRRGRRGAKGGGESHHAA